MQSAGRHGMQGSRGLVWECRRQARRWLGAKQVKKKKWVDSEFVVRRNGYNEKVKQARIAFLEEQKKDMVKQEEQKEEQKQRLKELRMTRSVRRR